MSAMAAAQQNQSPLGGARRAGARIALGQGSLQEIDQRCPFVAPLTAGSPPPRSGGMRSARSSTMR